MLKEEWLELSEMYNKITDNGLTSFSSEYLERYTELFAKSLQDKGDRPIHSRSNNTVV